jgi:hypothetical protein
MQTSSYKMFNMSLLENNFHISSKDITMHFSTLNLPPFFLANF